jgi:hypothetical protein
MCRGRRKGSRAQIICLAIREGEVSVAQLLFEMVCERPPRSLRSRLPHEGEINACNVTALFSPSARGRAAEGGRGSLRHHLELQLSNRARFQANFLAPVRAETPEQKAPSQTRVLLFRRRADKQQEARTTLAALLKEARL